MGFTCRDSFGFRARIPRMSVSCSRGVSCSPQYTPMPLFQRSRRQPLLTIEAGQSLVQRRTLSMPTQERQATRKVRESKQKSPETWKARHWLQRAELEQSKRPKKVASNFSLLLLLNSMRRVVKMSSVAVLFKQLGGAAVAALSSYRWGRGGPVYVPPNLPVELGRVACAARPAFLRGGSCV